jgi:exonuclease SbcD
MVRIVHIADVHLGAPCTYLGDIAPIRKKDFINSFEKVVNFCCEPRNNIDALIIAGDLFDMYDPPSDLVGIVQRCLSKLVQNNILVVAVPGTHDAFGYENSVYRKNQFPMKILCSPTFDDPIVHQLSGEQVFFYGMAYIRGVSKNPFESFSRLQKEGIHIGVLHGSVGIPSSWERDKDLCVSEEDIAQSHLDYLALGHFHNFQKNLYGSTLTVYPGSLESKDFTECGPRYMAVVDFAGGNPHIEKIAVNTRMVKTIDFNVDHYDCQSGSEIVNVIAKEFTDPESIVNLTITGTSHTPIDKKYIEEALRNNFFYVTVEDQTTVLKSNLIKSWKEEKTVRGMFVSKLLQKIEQADKEEKAVLEEALKIGIARFQEASP